MSSESNLKPFRSYSQLNFWTYRMYKFIVNYKENSILVQSMSYSLKAADKLIFDDSANNYIALEKKFTVYKDDSNCIDFDRCSTDIYNQGTNIYENKKKNLSNCTNYN